MLIQAPNLSKSKVDKSKTGEKLHFFSLLSLNYFQILLCSRNVNIFDKLLYFEKLGSDELFCFKIMKLIIIYQFCLFLVSLESLLILRFISDASQNIQSEGFRKTLHAPFNPKCILILNYIHVKNW